MKAKYIGKRLLIIIPTFIGITILAYFLSAMAPGSPLDLILATQNIGEADLARLTELYGLDKPVYVQYINWFGQLIQGNFGQSYRTGGAVLPMILERIGPTLMITLTSILVSVILAIPMGVCAAAKPYSWWDYIASGISFLAAATPNFFVGLMLVYFFSVKLKVLPTSGMYSSGKKGDFNDLLIHMIMPVAVLAFQQLGNLIRQVRGSMLEVLQEDYIRTAREKGLHEWKVILKHGLRNALIPVVTTISMNLPFIIGGAVVTEQIFSWPGIGSLMVQSINARDYPAIMGITVFIAVVVLIGNLITDLIYGILDPRISYK